MNRKSILHDHAGATLALIVALSGPCTAPAVPQASGTASTTPPEAASDAPAAASSSVEQGHTELNDAFDQNFREWRLEKRRQALADTEFKISPRLMYLYRNKYDGSDLESMAIGGSAGLKTGYFLDHISLGFTGYTSQHLAGSDSKDGAGMLEPGQQGYTVLGEAYADIRIVKDMNLYVGRKEYDTPYINRNDIRMTPNTFEAIVLMGTVKFGGGGEAVTTGKTIPGDGKTPIPAEKPAPVKGPTLKYGLGYFNRIKERNSVDFVPMSEDAGATADRGVFTAGALYQNGKFSFGLIDYYSPDIINIGYAEAKYEFAAGNLKPRLALQYSDQRSVGDELLKEDDFESHQFGVKVEVPVGQALFTAGYTIAGGDANMQNPWSGYPGYTSVQVEDFNRDGEGAFILRAGYDVKQVKGLSAYALWVHGTDPDVSGQYARDEYNFNLQWAPPEGTLKGLSLRLRYAIDDQHGGDSDTQTDFRVICNYTKTF